ncbi:MAG: thiamine phosphate synthase [Acidobacteria bacterium]|nr:thiamine phosphate synthase [Acidobacteriota bacterium]MBI3657988.1 thiamine phosphate synthase [Acidobacteriota bacterium]
MPFSHAMPKLYAITDRKLSARATHLEIVKELIRGGAEFIQVREKGLDALSLYQQIRTVMAYARPRGVIIIINDRVDLAMATDADGVHLGQDDLPVPAARRLLGPTKIIGLSTHSLAQALRAEQEPVDYIAMGPIFPTKTKESSNPPVGTAIIKKLSSRLSKPIVGIGGINLRNAAEVLAAGAQSVALISDLATAGNIAGRTRLLINTLEGRSGKRLRG